MTMPFPKKPWIRGLLLAGVGGVLVAVACWAPGPTDVQLEEPVPQAVELPPPPESVEVGEGSAGQGEEGTPTFTPFTVRPDIMNRSEVARALEAEYPPLLRDAGIGGTVSVWFHIDDEGRVQRTQVNETSGHKALDDAALKVADIIEFTPALNRDKRVPVWISLPISFATSTGGPPANDPAEVKKAETKIKIPPTPAALEAGEKPQPRSTEMEIGAAPTFTPFTVRPDIRNRTEIARALEQAYPPLLRDAGVGGTAQVWFFIDEDGVVQRTVIDESSGHEALDAAALDVARRIEFTPALNGDKRVPVWISLPITFTTR